LVKQLIIAGLLRMRKTHKALLTACLVAQREKFVPQNEWAARHCRI